MPKSKKSSLKSSKGKSKRKSNRVSKSEKSKNNETIFARCMSCRKQMKMEGAKLVTLKNGRSAMKGNCICGTKMFKFV